MLNSEYEGTMWFGSWIKAEAMEETRNPWLECVCEPLLGVLELGYSSRWRIGRFLAKSHSDN